MKKRVFLIHGWDGRPDNHWFPWLTWELKANGFDISAPQMPHAADPKVKEWLSFLREYVGKSDRDAYFVGHSLGCTAIVRYIDLLPKATRVGGCVFVAGFSGRLNIPEIREFYLPPQTAARGLTQKGTQIYADIIEKAKAHCDKFVMIFSDNDPYVPIAKSLEFAKQLGAKTILERGKKHFNDGITALPSALSALLQMSAGLDEV